MITEVYATWKSPQHPCYFLSFWNSNLHPTPQYVESESGSALEVWAYQIKWALIILPYRLVDILRPKQNRRHFADDIFKCIFLNEDVLISIKISLKFTSKSPINNIPTLAQIMAWCRPCDKPLSETILPRLLTHICVTRPQWVKLFMTTVEYASNKAHGFGVMP